MRVQRRLRYESGCGSEQMKWITANSDGKPMTFVAQFGAEIPCKLHDFDWYVIRDLCVHMICQ
jgi:hypothetical protein